MRSKNFEERNEASSPMLMPNCRNMSGLLSKSRSFPPSIARDRSTHGSLTRSPFSNRRLSISTGLNKSSPASMGSNRRSPNKPPPSNRRPPATTMGIGRSTSRVMSRSGQGSLVRVRDSLSIASPGSSGKMPADELHLSPADKYHLTSNHLNAADEFLHLAPIGEEHLAPADGFRLKPVGEFKKTPADKVRSAPMTENRRPEHSEKKYGSFTESNSTERASPKTNNSKECDMPERPLWNDDSNTEVSNWYNDIAEDSLSRNQHENPGSPRKTQGDTLLSETDGTRSNDTDEMKFERQMLIGDNFSPSDFFRGINSTSEGASEIFDNQLKSQTRSWKSEEQGNQEFEQEKSNKSRPKSTSSVEPCDAPINGPTNSEDCLMTEKKCMHLTRELSKDSTGKYSASVDLDDEVEARSIVNSVANSIIFSMQTIYRDQESMWKELFNVGIQTAKNLKAISPDYDASCFSLNTVARECFLPAQPWHQKPSRTTSETSPKPKSTNVPENGKTMIRRDDETKVSGEALPAEDGTDDEEKCCTKTSHRKGKPLRNTTNKEKELQELQQKLKAEHYELKLTNESLKLTLNMYSGFAFQ